MIRQGPLLLLLLAGCAEVEDPRPSYTRPWDLEPGRSDCSSVATEDRDRNGFGDFARTTTFNAEGAAVRIRETETDNGGDPPVDPATFRTDLEVDDQRNPVLTEEGPDDDSPRTQTGYRWNYTRATLRHTADVDRRNNGADLTRWTYEYDLDGFLTSWEIDATETTGAVTKLSWIWTTDGEVMEVRRFDLLGEELTETGRWSRENDGFGRVLREVELVDGVEGREARYERDGDGRLLSQTGAWDPLYRWSADDITYSGDCLE